MPLRCHLALAVHGWSELSLWVPSGYGIWDSGDLYTHIYFRPTYLRPSGSRSGLAAQSLSLLPLPSLAGRAAALWLHCLLPGPLTSFANTPHFLGAHSLWGAQA